ncbi:hypothetical protein LRS03_13550 [Rhizobacter sp. J219]|uniref:hypothetical protein n=1 Tax=Rhizobacter sp. J219 TaxID=2898430 RepID=UPI002150F585|nr:hypothetical protein [Rhizobacter sp. J219]MCR5883825.1 hypothetical protein [Rhizobacter sp. J219]
MKSSLIPTFHADHRSGSLDLTERWRLSVALLLAGVARKARSRSRPQTRVRSDLLNPALWNAIEAPQGRLANRAWELARGQQPAWLLNHGLRTHAWAQAFGVIAGLAPDREALFAAAMLHDAGLTPAAPTPANHCFAVRGARYAASSLKEVAAPATLNLVAEAIARHLDLQVDPGDGAEAHLLQAGAMADVLGHRVQQLPLALRTHVLTVHPRLQMKEELCRCMTKEITLAPHTRVDCYVRRIDFLSLIRQAPFEE